MKELPRPFRKTKPGRSFETFEVVLVQRHNGYTIAGQFIEPAASPDHTRSLRPAEEAIQNVRLEVVASIASKSG